MAEQSQSPAVYEVDKNEIHPMKRVYATHRPVIGDTFKQGDTIARVISIGKTLTGIDTLDYEIIGKRNGRVRTLYLTKER